MDLLPQELLRKVGRCLFPGDLLALALTSRWFWVNHGPDVLHPILLTSQETHHLFETSPRGYVICQFPYPQVRTDDFKRKLIEQTVFESNCNMTERDVALLLCAIGEQSLLYYNDRILLKYAALRCVVPLFMRIAPYSMHDQTDANMIQLLCASSLTQETKHRFLQIMMYILRHFKPLDWVINLARDYGMHDVVEILTR